MEHHCAADQLVQHPEAGVCNKKKSSVKSDLIIRTKLNFFICSSELFHHYGQELYKETMH